MVLTNEHEICAGIQPLVGERLIWVVDFQLIADQFDCVPEVAGGDVVAIPKPGRKHQDCVHRKMVGFPSLSPMRVTNV